jgi:predicted GNAT superfamily acetyltransferase
MLRAGIIIRDIEHIAEMRAVEALQKEVWGVSDIDVVPALALKPAVEVGGILVGAFDAGRLVAFAYGFAGHEGRRLIIHSDMLAVQPAYRERGLGYELKLAQRERALAQGVAEMTWTFDPLQSRNAHLNFRKLGVISDRYRINYYGEETSSFLHQNIGTDRLWVRWPLDSERVSRRLEGERPGPDLSSIIDGAARLVRAGPDGSPRLNQLGEGAPREHALIEIPGDINSLQRQNLALATAWREATRRAFGEALAAGYVVREFYRPTAGGQGSGTYLLSYGRSNE